MKEIRRQLFMLDGEVNPHERLEKAYKTTFTVVYAIIKKENTIRDILPKRLS